MDSQIDELKHMLRRYDDMRIQCLRWSNFHPDSFEVCHQSLRHVPQMNGITLAMAALADDMALTLKRSLAAAEIGKAL